MESTNNNSAMILPYFASMDMGGTLSSPRSTLTCNSNSGLYYPYAGGGAAVASPLEAPPPVHRERGPVMSLFPSDDASNYGSRSRVSSGNNSNGAAHPPPPRPFFGQLQLKCHRSRALATLCVSPSHGEQEASSMARLEEDTVRETLPVCPSPTSTAASTAPSDVVSHTSIAKKGTPPLLHRCVVEVPVSPSIPHVTVPPPLPAIATSEGEGDRMAVAKEGEEEEEILVVVCPSATHHHLVAAYDGLAGSTSAQAEPHSHVLCSVEQHAPNPEGNETNLSPVLQQQQQEEEGVAANLGSNCHATPTSVLVGTPQRGTVAPQQEAEAEGEEEDERGAAVDLYGSLIVGESSAMAESCRRREGSSYPTVTIGPKNAMSSWRTPTVPLKTAEPPMAGSFDGVLPEGGEATPTLSELHHSTRDEEGDSPAITHELSGCSPMVHSITQPFSSSGSVSDATFGSGSSRPFGRKVFSSGTPRSGGTTNDGLLLVPHRPPQSIVNATFTSASFSSQRSAALLRGGSLAALREHPTTSSSSSSPVTATAMLSETNHSVVTKPLSAVPSLCDEVMQQQQQSQSQSLFDRQQQTNPLCEEEEEGTFTAASPTSPATGAAAAATLRFPGRSGLFVPRKGSFTASNGRVPLHEYRASSPHDLVCLIHPSAEEDHLPLCPLNSRDDTTITTSSTVSYRSTTLKPDTLLCHPQPPPWAFPASCSSPAGAREHQRVGKAQSLTCSPPRSQKCDGSQHFNRSLTVVATTTTKHSVPVTEPLPLAPTTTTYLMPCVPTPSRESHHTGGGESHDDQMSFSMDYVDGALRSTTTTTAENQPKEERDDHHHDHHENKKKEILTAHSSFVSHGDVPPTTLPTIAQWRCPTLPPHAAPGAGGLAAQSITTSSSSSSCTAVLAGRSFASLKVSMTQTQLELAMALMSVCGAPIAQ